MTDSTKKPRLDRLPKPIIAVGPLKRKVPEHLLLARLYRFVWLGETQVITSDRATVQAIRRLQAAFHFANPGSEIPAVDVEVVSIQKLTKLNVVEIFKNGLESIVLDTEIRTLPPFTHVKHYERYTVDFVRKPRKPKKRKAAKA